MKIAIHQQIEARINRSKKGTILFPTDFRGMGSEAAIKMALSRLVKEGKVERLAHGIYIVPKEDPMFGKIQPSLETIAETIAKKEHVKIKPAGTYALHKLGLTTQVPTKVVYLTDGPPKFIHIGSSTIRFKPTTPKKMALEGKISSLVIQALEEIKQNLEDLEKETKDRLVTLLLQEKPETLKHDLKLAKAKVNDYIISLLKTYTYDKLAT
jgi:hypothetical protein